MKKYLKKNGIKKISLFWSFARWEDTKDSDVDFLYEREKKCKMWYLEYFDIIDFFEKLLWRKVDFVSKKHLNGLIKDKILSNKIDII